MVDWSHLGQKPFTEPFFEDTLRVCLGDRSDLTLTRQTPIKMLGECHSIRPGITPTGFIFHMSRCGSTLIAQMLASLPKHVVISEAPPIDAVLRGHSDDGERIAWLQWLVSALGQPRRGGETRYFIKFDSWHVLSLPVIARAFPAVPWIFVHRDPAAIVASHLRQRGMHTVPQLLDPALFDVDRASAFHIPAEEYVTRVLACMYKVAFTHLACGGMAVDYAELPDAVCSKIPRHFGFTLTAGERAVLMHSAQYDAKNPSSLFKN